MPIAVIQLSESQMRNLLIEKELEQTVRYQKVVQNIQDLEYDEPRYNTLNTLRLMIEKQIEQKVGGMNFPTLARKVAPYMN